MLLLCSFINFSQKTFQLSLETNLLFDLKSNIFSTTLNSLHDFALCIVLSFRLQRVKTKQQTNQKNSTRKEGERLNRFRFRGQMF